MSTTPCSVQLLCKAPLPGFAKTRLVPELGLAGVATLQTDLVRRAVNTAVAADVGSVTVWCAPDTTHPLFNELARSHGVNLKSQPTGDLGRRMQIAAQYALSVAGSTILIGNDCPIMTSDYLRLAAVALRQYDTVVGPAEDGGYVLLALKEPLPGLFNDMPWGTGSVLSETLSRLERLHRHFHLLPTLWDIDSIGDLNRWHALQDMKVVGD